MSALELWVVSYLANSLWMVPVVFAAAWAVARVTRSLGPGVAHRIWVAALVIEILLPALHLQILYAGSLSWILRGLHATAAADGRTTITMTTASEYLKGGLMLPHGVVSAVAILYAGTLLYFATRLAWSLRKTYVIAGRASATRDDVQIRWRAVTTVAGVSAAIAESRDACGPVTIGMRNGLLVLPEGFAARTADEDLTAVMAHECAHMVRHDFGKNLVYSVIALPCAFHPALWLTRARLSESREMVCDAMAAEMLGDRKKYARSLLRLVSGMVERVPQNIHAIGIFDANHLERRIMTLTRKKTTTVPALRVAMFAACAAIAFATCASALSLRTDIGTEASGQTENGAQAHSTMPVLIHSKAPEYPAGGKEAHLSGVCLVALVVDEQGMPKEVHIIKSLRPDFDQKAMDAIREYRFKPALSDGRPIEKHINVEVKFAYF